MRHILTPLSRWLDRRIDARIAAAWHGPSGRAVRPEATTHAGSHRPGAGVSDPRPLSVVGRMIAEAHQSPPPSMLPQIQAAGELARGCVPGPKKDGLLLRAVDFLFWSAVAGTHIGFALFLFGGGQTAMAITVTAGAALWFTSLVHMLRPGQILRRSWLR